MTSVLDKELQSKLLTPSVLRLMRALNQSVRVVGGAVRDALLGRTLGDIDLATTMTPDCVRETLAQNGIKAVPTGLPHGTITAVVDHVGYEITTLRRDVETDGRHAEVAFTDDWCEDAARRDFTLNALYVDAEGVLYDYFSGVEDAKAGRVRFIGDARARIREDVLRILRFFRFYAFFGKGPADADAKAACRDLAPLIPKLSVERIAHEFVKLLSAEDPLPSLLLMHECGVMQHFLPEAVDFSRLRLLLKTEKKYQAPPSSWIRFAAVLPQDKATAASVAMRLKLSKRDSETLCVLAELPKRISANLNATALRRLIYAYGPEYCRAAALLTDKEITEALKTIAAWDFPLFPLTGKDIVKQGIPAGPRVGEILRAVEDWWRDGDFYADRKACLTKAQECGK